MLTNNSYIQENQMDDDVIYISDTDTKTPKGFSIYTEGIDSIDSNSSSYKTTSNSLNDSVGIFSNISGNDEIKEYVLNKDDETNSKYYNKFYIRDKFTRDIIFELIGTYIYIVIGNSMYSQVVIYSLDNSIMFEYWPFISISWGLSLIFGMYVALIGNNDGYLNPILIFSLYLLNIVERKKFIIYSISYFIISFLASLTVYVINIINIERIGYNINTANIFATYKNDNISITTGFFTELFISSLFTFIFLCINRYHDKENIYNYSKKIGLLFILISLSIGFSTQCIINPAKDFGSRLLTLFAPWYGNVFKYSSSWFWVPIIAPYFGALIGTGLFYILIDVQL